MRHLFVLGLSIFISGCGIISTIIDTSTTSSTPPTVTIPLTADSFVVAYDGGGNVDFNSSVLTFAPKAATASNETHAGLVLIKSTVELPVQDFELTVDLAVTQQLRQNTPANDWEVFWLFFSYNGSPSEKTTNYFMTKPQGGAELGLAHGELGQKFISTDTGATTALGSRHIFKFRREGSTFTVHRDGSLFYSFTESLNFPQKLYSSRGSLGFYSEDAEVKVYSVTLKRLDTRLPANSPVLPTLSSSSPLVKSPGSSALLGVSVDNSHEVGPLFWSCTFKKLNGDLTGVSNQDCLSQGSLTSQGLLDWTPSLNDIGSWFFNFESSELYSGFSKKTMYLQVRPTWSSSNQLFLYDPQFSLAKTIDSQNILVARTLASENNKTEEWPSLTNTGTMNLAGLNESSPWVTDSVSLLSALHFNALQADTGLPLAVSNIDGSKDLRLSYWFKRDNTDSKAAILANHSNGNLQSRHWMGVISSSYFDGATEVACSDPTAATDDWVFVTTQVISNTLKTFVNGREVCSSALGTTYAFSSPLRVGPKVETFFPFAGRLSEIAGYKQSTSTEIFNDFLATADRYRVNKVGAVTNTDLVLHWDVANANRGMTIPASATPSSATTSELFDLGPYKYSKVYGNFNGTASSGYITTTAAQSHIQFDNVDDYIQVPMDTHLSLGPTWTIEAWLQPGAAKGNDTGYSPGDQNYPLFKTVFEKAYYDNAAKLSHGLGLRIGPDNTVDAFIVNNYGFTDTVQGVTHLNPNQWYHAVVSYDKTTGVLKSYVNGALESTKAVDIKRDVAGTPQADGDILAGDSGAILGVPFDVDGRRRFNGKLAILRVYQKALTDTQVKNHCRAQKGRFSVLCN